MLETAVSFIIIAEVDNSSQWTHFMQGNGSAFDHYKDNGRRKSLSSPGPPFFKIFFFFKCV